MTVARIIERAIAAGADPLDFTRGGCNAALARLRAKLGPEAVEQAVVVAVLRSAGVRFCAAPNGAKVRKAVAAEAQAVGLEPGVPDLLIFVGEPRRSWTSRVVALEFKAPALRPKTPGADPTTYSHVSPAQRAWLLGLRAFGWRAEVVYGADEAINLLRVEGVLPPNTEEGTR